MEILYGQNLVNALRKIMDASEYRIWISVPYIGGLISIKKILGERWLNNQRIDFKIITDIENNSAIDSQTIATFYHRGEVKTLLGLHAKIYISDQSCLITSANLTKTAFTKRHEVGILLNQSKEAIKLFEELWEKAEDMNLETVSKIKKATTKSVEESDSRRLKQLWNLPSNENPVKINVKENQYIDYFRIVADFKNFATKYESTQRIWSNKPLFFEIDGLFNYLYHHAPGIPSKTYNNKKISPRKLNESEQMKEIKKWVIAYAKWNDSEKGGDDIFHRLYYSQKLAQYFVDERIFQLTEEEIKELLLCTNSMRVDQRNIPQIFKKNDLKFIKECLHFLIYGKSTLATRMTECKKIKNLGISTINEIVGLMNPNEYPIVNNNSISGMKFFGYELK